MIQLTEEARAVTPARRGLLLLLQLPRFAHPVLSVSEFTEVPLEGCEMSISASSPVWLRGNRHGRCFPLSTVQNWRRPGWREPEFAVVTTGRLSTTAKK
jgi:hypothetical protein